MPELSTYDLKEGQEYVVYLKNTGQITRPMKLYSFEDETGTVGTHVPIFEYTERKEYPPEEYAYYVEGDPDIPRKPISNSTDPNTRRNNRKQRKNSRSRRNRRSTRRNNRNQHGI